MKFTQHLDWRFRWLLVITAVACSPVPSKYSDSGQEVKPTAEMSNTQTERFPSGVLEQLPRGDEAWQSITQGGRFRLARSTDFDIPEKAKDRSSCRIPSPGFAYVGGDFNRDGLYLDLAFIVIDTAETGRDRFSVVILNAPASKEDLPSAHWIFTKKDLSHAVLGAASESLFLTECLEDGSTNVSHVRWEKHRQMYFIDNY